MSGALVALEFSHPRADGTHFRRIKSLGLARQMRSYIQCRFLTQKERDMDSIELLVYAVIGVVGTLGVAAVIGYKVADHLDKKHHTD
ncbi:hypothetical protein PLUA15_110051 [Pseudomonas lundensis]|uniref:Uncharacterized protein n=1 Tax=Pseudomonas lundensis TaxID=86185 RepID=A0AAX2H424_9PSED|nr:hypothetical protein PLUA15_110051 [Pseudomonas lundensis]